MAKWIVAGTTLEYNPFEDTGWVRERVHSDQHPIGANDDVLQHGGFHSPTRECSGFLKSASVKSALETAFLNAANITVTDHNGESATCQILELKFQEVMDASNVGRTFRWRMKLMGR